jgi:hypothetical protein
MVSLEFYGWNHLKTSAMCILSWTDASVKWMYSELTPTVRMGPA